MPTILQRTRDAVAIEDERPARRNRSSAVDELVCPITLNLPWDPVTAEDGRIYERSAILQHIKNNQGNLKSPMTNESMGPRLFASLQFKNIIEKMIDNGDIDEELAASWKKKREDKQKFEKLKSEAEVGCAAAMLQLGIAYQHGLRGTSKDLGKAMEWFKKASDAGCVTSMVFHGLFLALDQQTQSEGTVLLGFAAGNGSSWACFSLGLLFALGESGLSVNKTQALKLFRKGSDEESVYCKELLKDSEDDRKFQHKCYLFLKRWKSEFSDGD